MASIPSYVIGIWYIAKSSGFNLGLKNPINRAVAFAIPLAMVVASYAIFLRDYDPSQVENKFAVLLDYVYPIGQAVFVAMAISTYINTRKFLGGVMRDRVLFVLFALVFQYVADSLFIANTRSEVWYAGGISDLMFVISYFLMTMGLIQFDTGLISNVISKKNKE